MSDNKRTKLTTEEIKFIIDNPNMSSRTVCKHLWGHYKRKSTINDLRNKLKEGKGTGSLDAGKRATVKPFKVFFGDVETSGTISVHFGRFRQFISPEAVIQEPYLLTFAGSWNTGELDEDSLHYHPQFKEDHRDDKELVKHLWEILDECDVFVAHNSAFDVGWFNQRCAFHNMPPPSPYKVICTLKGLKKSFSLPSNSLAAATRYFGLENKLSHSGISLWLRCMEGEEDAFEEMLEYNRGDIPTLMQLYYKTLPFVKDHPNVALYYNDSEPRCTRCGSSDLKDEGVSCYTGLSEFKVWRCTSCSSNVRARNNLRSKNQMKNTLANIV